MVSVDGGLSWPLRVIDMNIINPGLTWEGDPLPRTITTYIIIHHAAAMASVQDIHQWHLSQGWRGIGYHFYIRRDGSVYSGRPVDTVGAHAEGYNYNSVGICFEGDFERVYPTDAQYDSGRELIAYLRTLYPGALLIRHRDVNATLCPGSNFDMTRLVIEETQDPSDEASPWSSEARAWAVAAGIVKGDGTGYHWRDKVTREELVTMLHRMIRYQDTSHHD